MLYSKITGHPCLNTKVLPANSPLKTLNIKLLIDDIHLLVDISFITVLVKTNIAYPKPICNWRLKGILFLL